jgi:hypothetical protein
MTFEGNDDPPWRFGNEPVQERLNVRRECALFKDDPLRPLLTIIGHEPVVLSHDELSRYATAYEYFYLSLRRYFEAMSLSIRWQKGPKWLRGRRFGPRQRQVATEYNAIGPYLELDFANCLIHARIVCDRAVALARHFIRTPPVPSFTSFHDHKRFFVRMENTYGTHEEYADYFRTRTAWFDMPLKPVRDQYFVHHGPKHMRFLGYDSDQDLQMVIILPAGPAHTPYSRVESITISVRRLARDLHEFLQWFNAYGMKALSER